MGCLNDRDNKHWFANIHLSGPCNRSCYFCIGQHMMKLDPLNNLNTFPLPGWDRFVDECTARGVEEVYVTGSNTDPLLHHHLREIVGAARADIGATVVGLRTNGVSARAAELVPIFDQVSLSVTSFDPELYRITMGQGDPPDLGSVMGWARDLWANVVLCPETVLSGDFIRTLSVLRRHGVRKANLREPYGQPHVGDPMASWAREVSRLYGNPQYDFHGLEVTYWDVHYTGVSSVNLYADGRVSTDYPVTAHNDTSGPVREQSCYEHGRQRPQWQGLPEDQDFYGGWV